MEENECVLDCSRCLAGFDLEAPVYIRFYPASGGVGCGGKCPGFCPSLLPV